MFWLCDELLTRIWLLTVHFLKQMIQVRAFSLECRETKINTISYQLDYLGGGKPKPQRKQLRDTFDTQ